MNERLSGARLAAALVLVWVAASPLQAANHAAAAQVVAADMADGEVRKVDKDTQKITLKHGEIKSLDMPGMTMLFRVKDPAMLDTVKVGDKVKFRAEKSGGAITLTEIQVAR